MDALAFVRPCAAVRVYGAVLAIRSGASSAHPER